MQLSLVQVLQACLLVMAQRLVTTWVQTKKTWTGVKCLVDAQHITFASFDMPALC